MTFHINGRKPSQGLCLLPSLAPCKVSSPTYSERSLSQIREYEFPLITGSKFSGPWHLPVSGSMAVRLRSTSNSRTDLPPYPTHEGVVQGNANASWKSDEPPYLAFLAVSIVSISSSKGTGELFHPIIDYAVNAARYNLIRMLVG